LNSCDAAASSLGTGLSLVTAMTRNNVRRLVCISALGVGTIAYKGRLIAERLNHFNRKKGALI